MDKVLTVSVAAYNSEAYISRCLDSLVKTRVIKELDVIVINDGSQDTTLEIAREYERVYPDTVVVVDKENGGHGSTINSSLVRAKGKYYKVVDSDDWVELEGIEKLVELLKKSDADVILNPYNIVDYDTGSKTLKPLYKPDTLEYGKKYELSEISEDTELVMHAITFRTELLKRMDRKIDEHCFYVDQEYVLYPLSQIKTVCYHSFAVYDYLLGAEEQSCSLKNKLKRMDQHIRVCNSILTCYLENNYDEAQEKIMLNSISRLYHVQFDLFLEMSSKEGKQGFKNFDKGVKEKSRKVYDHLLKGVSAKRKIKLSLLRLTRYGLYGFFSWERKHKGI